MNAFLPTLLTLILIYGYPVVVATVLFGTFGLPLPVTAILLAAGSFSASGVLSLPWLVGLITSTAVLGDLIGYVVGRKMTRSLTRGWGRSLGITATHLHQSQRFFARWGVSALFFSRWLVTPLGVPMNILAGMEHFPVGKFLVFTAVGEFVWAGLYTYLGYVFAANWEVVTEYLDGSTQVLALVVVGVVFVLAGAGFHQRRKQKKHRKEQ